MKLIHTLKLIPLLVVLLGSIANAEDSVQVVVVSDEAMDLHILAMNGDVNAQANLGLMYLGGNGVSQDYKEAVKWLTKAAEQGHAQSQYNLGSMCANGHGLPQDRKEAGKWYAKAAEQGIPQAQHNLGFMYATGDGLPKDYVQAHKWWSLAAMKGQEGAKKNSDIVARKMTPEQIAEAKELAREWWEEHQPKD